MADRSSSLRADAIRIWQAGLEAVRSERLMREAVHCDDRMLVFHDLHGEQREIDLRCVRRIAVVGAGKAGAGMAQALEQILGPQRMAEKRVAGWVNVPADCVPNTKLQISDSHAAESESNAPIKLFAARPAGINEPTAEGVRGTEKILRLVGSLEQDDLCIALISGGGSALLPAPIEGISLADKLAVTRFLSAAGADIAELNTVRKQLSRIKGGGLARACRAGQLMSLIISDIPGDPLDLIASGSTVEDRSTADEALAIFDKYGAKPPDVPLAVFEVLRGKAKLIHTNVPNSCEVSNFVIGNNATAVDAAGAEAERLGYAHAMTCANKPEGAVELIGRHLADMALSMLQAAGPNCLISGGEGTVKLAPEAQRGLGGRNQQTVLAALARWIDAQPKLSTACQVAILSGGTDGEDGPTDAAGAFFDTQVISAASQQNLNTAEFLNRNDAYHFFEPLGALLKTGPTNTNVCDVRVVLVQRR